MSRVEEEPFLVLIAQADLQLHGSYGVCFFYSTLFGEADEKEGEDAEFFSFHDYVLSAVMSIVLFIVITPVPHSHQNKSEAHLHWYIICNPQTFMLP